MPGTLYKLFKTTLRDMNLVHTDELRKLRLELDVKNKRIKELESHIVKKTRLVQRSKNALTAAQRMIIIKNVLKSKYDKGL